MGVEYLPQFQSVTNVMNTEYGENNNLLTFMKKKLFTDLVVIVLAKKKVTKQWLYTKHRSQTDTGSDTQVQVQVPLKFKFHVCVHTQGPISLTIFSSQFKCDGNFI